MRWRRLFTKQATKIEDGVEYRASDYAYVPDPERPSTWKLRLAEGRSGNITVAQLGRAAAALSPGGFRGQRVQIPASDIPAVKRRIRREYRRLGVEEEDMPDSVKEMGGFFLTKAQDGSYRWLAIYSNKFRDRDTPPEIVSSKSHIRFVERVQKGEAALPQLWLYHIPLHWGDAEHVGYDEETGFAFAAGRVKEGMNWVAETLMKFEGELGVSHGMRVLKRNDVDSTIIEEHETVEISPLPMKAAANFLTGFEILTEVKAMLTDEDRKKLEALGFDPDAVQDALSDKAKVAKSLGLDYKEESEDGDDESPEVETKFATREEVAELAGEVAAVIRELVSRVQNLEVAEEERKSATPAASALFRSVIGTQEAKLDGRSKLAKQKPAENKTSDGPTAIRFLNNLLTGESEVQ